MNGIFNYLKKNFNTRDEISTKHSSYGFQTSNIKNSMICFEFKKYFIIPFHYIIRSYYSHHKHYLKTWVIEGSIDGDNWFL